MKRPSFQFYPADWQANSNLRRCTHEEKGIWVDVMCLLHDQEEYGVVRWPLADVAQAIGCNPQKLRGIVSKGVLKGDDKAITDPFVYTPRSGRKDGEPITLVAAQDGPLWYSSRMVKDEYVRATAGASTRFQKTRQGEDQGDGKTTPYDAPRRSPSHSPTRRQGERQGEDQGDGSSSSSSSSSSPSVTTPPSIPRDGPFPMFTAWSPGGNFEALTFKAGIKPPSEADLAEFVSFWISRGEEREQGAWEHALLQNLLHRKAKNAGAAPAKRAPKGDNFAQMDYGKGGAL